MANGKLRALGCYGDGFWRRASLPGGPRLVIRLFPKVQLPVSQSCHEPLAIRRGIRTLDARGERHGVRSSLAHVLQTSPLPMSPARSPRILEGSNRAERVQEGVFIDLSGGQPDLRDIRGLLGPLLLLSRRPRFRVRSALLQGQLLIGLEQRCFLLLELNILRSSRARS